MVDFFGRDRGSNEVRPSRFGQGIKPNCVAVGLTLRLTRMSYQKSGVANEAQGDGLSGDASSSL